MKRSKTDLQVVQLDPATLELVRVWISVTFVAKTIGATREGIYQATRTGIVRYGYRWMFYDAYQVWQRKHNA